MKVRYVVTVLIIVGIGIGAFFWGRASNSDAILRGIPRGSATYGPPAAKGPIGPASGDVEYICSNATSGAGTRYSAAIAAVTNGNGTWTCPTSYFGQLGEVQVGGSFFCSVTVTETEGSPSAAASSLSQGPYAATIGHFTTGGVIGSYYGAYCPAPVSNTFHIWSTWPGASTEYSMTTS
ncbi:MAG: hypothetical protein JWM55_1877 [Acidimicrobiaceae bacterium]|nr:hypothetical protein [Acidimicrobiaceae bacterium]